VKNLLSSSLLSKNVKIKIYRTLLFSIGVKLGRMWREEHGLRVFEIRVLKKIFGPKKEEVTAEWRRLHNEELNNPYTSPNIIRVIKSRRIRRTEH